LTYLRVYWGTTILPTGKDGGRRCQSGVTAERHLRGWREPSKPKTRGGRKVVGAVRVLLSVADVHVNQNTGQNKAAVANRL
jgi:hypothetical protein